ncbi:Pentatricopeptide repeat-containing protein [Rhynchospora pubera]|uniref:Pentatricopeptide repeat-containing protein n=1 Tax=Rhynchospora pubera TaxID=906938 RepID=A0AAV8GA03_9POAL|nr:Pentatricopeptide repeat-containing protein [Rhynchospora pubera]
MASKRLVKSLPSLIAKHKHLMDPTSHPPPSPSPSPPPPLPSISLPSLPLHSLPLSPLPPASLSSLSHYLSLHLPSLPSLNPSEFTHFLRRHIRYHPNFSPYDFHLFMWVPSSLPSFRHDHHSYLYMAQSLSFSSRLSHFRIFLSHLKLNPCPCTDSSIFSCPFLEQIYRAAILTFCRAGWLEDAEVAFSDLCRSVDGKLGSSVYNVLLHGFVHWRKHEKALQLFDKMLKRDLVQPDAYSFNIIIDSCCRSGDIDSALDWLGKMKDMGCEPNVVSFNTIIRGFFRKKKFKEGIGVAHEMIDLGCKFSVATCEILINGLCYNGKTKEAADLLVEFLLNDSIPNEGFDCHVLLESLCKEGLIEKAIQVFDLLSEKKGCSSLSVVGYITLIEELRKSGRLDYACKVMESMVKAGFVPDTITINCLFENLCDLGKTFDANRLRSMALEKGFESDGLTFSIIVRGFAKEGKIKEGKGVLDEMLDAGFIPNITTYNRFLDDLHKKGGIV